MCVLDPMNRLNVNIKPSNKWNHHLKVHRPIVNDNQIDE